MLRLSHFFSKLVGTLLICSVFATTAFAKNEVNNVRIWHAPDNTRVVLDTNKEVSYKYFTLDNPKRLVIDIENGEFRSESPKLDTSNRHIQTIRVGTPKKDVLRVVLELKKELKPNIFSLKPYGIYGYRLVIDLNDIAIAEVTKESEPQSKPQSQAKPQSQSKPTDQTPAQKPPKKLVIAIDAGHGGDDPGALGYKGTREKKVTLAISKELDKLIDADPRMNGVMIRTSDYYVGLSNRRVKAKQNNADMFISIHADAFRKSSVRGFSVFALSQRGASSTTARALADKENASDLIGGVSLKDKDDLLASVLLDLSMTKTISKSVSLGNEVIKELKTVGKMHSKRVEQAGFAVLKSPDIPSILVETGFITNPTDEKNLKSRWFQKKVAKAIYNAINSYFKQQPYSGKEYSGPASNYSSGNRVHKVKRGDTLSEIADLYGVSMRAIRDANKMKSNTVMLGQRLKIPSSSKQVKSGYRVYTVKRGDTLSSIADKHRVSMSKIRSVNNMRSFTVYIGQKLKIPY